MDSVSVPVSARPGYPGEDGSVARYPGFDFDASAQHFVTPSAHTMSSGRDTMRSISTNPHVNNSQILSGYSALYGLPAPPMGPSMPPQGLHQQTVIPAHDVYATPRHSISSLRHDSVVSIYQPDDAERNPVYRSIQFRQYRARQEQRQDKEAAIWPPELENPFLDALLLIPIMGRKKYFMRHQQYGRNMLIGDYVWIAYVMGLKSGQAPDAKNMRRSRKQISSHIQVLKNFFKYHRYFHFFFPARDKESGKKTPGAAEIETVETISLKNNPVLVALSEGRFPEVRPNYDYFAGLLDQDCMVTVRPKTCSMCVVSREISIGHDKIPRTADGKPLALENYPHLAQNLEGDGSRARRPEGILLHEYTRVIGQKESDTAKELVRSWEKTAPAIVEKLNLPEPQHEAPLTIIEMSVSLELHRTTFHSSAWLNVLVEMSIASNALQSHRWRSVTRLTRPRELCASPDDPLTEEMTEEIGTQYVHHPDCGTTRVVCDCASHPRKEIKVPFPINNWASMLQIATCHANRNREGDPRESEAAAEDLISQVVMVQELWSSPCYPGHETRWNRQALIMWRFNGAFKPRGSASRHDVSPSTAWRFLTVNDPTSEYHQQQAYISADQATAMAMSTNSITSPTSANIPQAHNNMADRMAPAWPTAPIMRGIGSISSSSHGSLDTNSDVLSGALSGAPTPPPTAGLYHPGYDAHALSHSFMPSGLSTQMDPHVNANPEMVGDAAGAHPQNPYLASVTQSFNSGVCEPSLGAWDVASSLETWSQQQPGNGGSASPYEPTIVDKSANAWQDDSRDDSQGFWPSESKAMWPAAVGQPGASCIPGQQWDTRSPWDAGNRTQSFDRASEAASPLTTLGKRRRDDGSEEDEKVPTDYQRISHKRASLRDAQQLSLSESVQTNEW
ncbi:Conidiophore development regulator abaA [Ceratocystis lukuohia]|uniref:Conidiophore development regulator abaA n=1 Tax=Ceratocystis lukuohia TaxID=2019550 RepID=A0ABR4M8T2_9PEZI